MKVNATDRKGIIMGSKKVPIISVFLYIFIVTGLFTGKGNAQLSGLYFIGQGGDFSTLQEAWNAIVEQGVSGDTVRFLIIPGIYNGQTYFRYPRASYDTTVILFSSTTGNPDDVILYFEPSSYDNNYVVKLSGVNDLEFRGITFHGYGTIHSRAIWLESGFKRLTFANCIFKGTYKADNDVRHALMYFDNATVNRLKVIGCVFEEASHGIESSNGSFTHVTIRNNRFTRIGYEGISLNYSYHTVIDKNLLEGMSYGINLANSSGHDTIWYNEVRSRSGSIGLHEYYGTNPGPSLIMNNILVVTNGSRDGNIFIQSVKHLNIVHNTVLLISNNSSDKNINIVANSFNYDIRLKNNLVVNFYKGYTLYNAQAGAVTECDHNVFYSCGNVPFYWQQHIYTIEELQQISGMNEHSMFGFPFAKTSQNYIPVSPFIDDKGAPSGFKLPDYLGNPRDLNTPDAGAIEFEAEYEPPMHGLYTIGEGGQFFSLQDGLEEALLRGIDKPITFAYLDGIYSCKDTLFFIPGSSEENTITITSMTGDTSAVQLSVIDMDYNDHIYLLLGSRYFRIKNLTFFIQSARDLSLNAEGYLTDLWVENNRFQFAYFNTSAQLSGILLSGALYHDFHIKENHFVNFGTTIEANHSGYSITPGTLEISDNLFEVGYSLGYIFNVNTLLISGNIALGQSAGFTVSNIGKKVVIAYNIISGRYYEALDLYNSTFLPYDTSMIYNNFFIRTLPGNVTYDVVRLYGVEYLWVANNNIFGAVNNPARGTVEISDCNHIHLLNNIIHNDSSGYALFKKGTYSLDESDYNNFYTRGPNLASWNGVICENLDSLRNLSGMDDHSQSVKVDFASPTDLHIHDPRLDNKGYPLPFVRTDIDGEFRHPVHPDVGADEFTPFPQNPPYLVQSIPDQMIQEDQRNVILVQNLSLHFADPDTDDVLTFSAIAVPPEVTIRLVPMGGNTISLLGTPEANFFGQVEIRVTCTDVTNLSVSDTFMLSVQNVPDPPVAVNDTFQLAAGDSVLLDVLSNDSDPDGESLKIIAVTPPTQGAAKITDDSSHIVFYFLASSDTIIMNYTVTDPSGRTATGVIMIIITPLFDEDPVYLPPLSMGSAQWVDVDNDDDLDLFLAGMRGHQTNQIETMILYNDMPSIYNFNRKLSLPPVAPGKQKSAAWGDYNGDGWIDLLISGYSGDSLNTFSILLLKNNHGTFKVEQVDLVDVYNGANLFFDYDHDGDLDILISGQTNPGASSGIVRIYRNVGFRRDGSVIFEPVTDFLNYSLVETEAVAADFDNNGYTDLLISGRNGFQCFTTLYLHFEQTWLTVPVDPPLFKATFSVMDYDVDGDLDVLYGGLNLYDENRTVSGILRNRYRETGEAAFENITGFSPVEGGFVSFIDADMDGDVDAFMFGKDTLMQNEYGILIRQDSTGFHPVGPTFPGSLFYSSMAPGDYNGDRKPDLVLISDSTEETTGNVISYAKIYKNLSSNDGYYIPIPYFAFGPQRTENSIRVSWAVQNPPHVGDPPIYNPTFNVGFSTAPASGFLYPVNSNLQTGFHRLALIGNHGKATSYSAENLISGKQYFVHVQSIGQNLNTTRLDMIPVTTKNNYFEEYYIAGFATIPLFLSAGDVNGDGYSEIYIANSYLNSNHNVILERTHPVSFDTLVADIRSRYKVKSLFLDLDGDGDEDRVDCDLLFQDTYGYELFMLFFEWDGNQFIQKNQILIPGYVTDAITADVDHDGQEDFLLVENGQIHCYYRNRYQIQKTAVLYQGEGQLSLDLADVNRDGWMDLIVAEKDVKILINQGNRFSVSSVPMNLMKPIVKFLEGNADMSALRFVVANEYADADTTRSLLYFLEVQHSDTVFILSRLDSLPLQELPEIINVGNFNNNSTNDFYVQMAGDGVQPSVQVYLDPAANLAPLNTYMPSMRVTTSTLCRNNTGSLDIVMAGYTTEAYGAIMFNTMVKTVSKPQPPANLRAKVLDSSILFIWDPSPTEMETGMVLTYNLRIGTTPGGNEIMACNADSTGLYHLLIPGNVGQATHWELKNIPPDVNIYWSVQAIGSCYQGSDFAPEQVIVLTGVEDELSVPATYALYQNYPNPFNPVTEIRFALPRREHVTIQIFNALGQLVETLIDQEMEAGYHNILWHAASQPSGIYFYRMTTAHFKESKKMILIR